MNKDLGGISGSREPDPSCTGSGPAGFDPGRAAERLRDAAELEQMCADAINDLLKSGRLTHAYGAPAWDAAMARAVAFSRAAELVEEEQSQ